MIEIPKKPPRKRIEQDVTNDVRKWLGETSDVRLMRNNVGELRTVVRMRPDLGPNIAEVGRPVTYGLGTGSPDLVGHLAVEVMPWGVSEDMESRVIARSMAIELKAPGKRPSPDQVAWMNVRRQQGWAIGWSDSLDGVIEIVEKARRWEI